MIGVISNPVRYSSRYKLFWDWKEAVERSGARVLVVELAYGARPFEVTNATDPWDLQLRVKDDAFLWMKESMINAGIRHLTRLDPTWQYVCWEDCDVEHYRDDWPVEVVHALQHYAFIQTWTNAIHVDARGNVIRLDYSFASSYLKGARRGDPNSKEYDPYWHSGFSWAARRQELEQCGLLISESLIGAADHQMAHALVGNVNKSYHGQVSQGYKDVFDQWQAKALHYVRKNIGCIDGHLTHDWHGSRVNRRYVDRWEIVLKSDFDPRRDLTVDSQGLHVLNHLGPKYIYLRNALREYFTQRDEDCAFNHDAEAPVIARMPPPPVSPFSDASAGKKVSYAQTGPDGK